jgi:hypothetical protein
MLRSDASPARTPFFVESDWSILPRSLTVATVLLNSATKACSTFTAASALRPAVTVTGSSEVASRLTVSPDARSVMVFVGRVTVIAPAPEPMVSFASRPDCSTVKSLAWRPVRFPPTFTVLAAPVLVARSTSCEVVPLADTTLAETPLPSALICWARSVSVVLALVVMVWAGSLPVENVKVPAPTRAPPEAKVVADARCSARANWSTVKLRFTGLTLELADTVTDEVADEVAWVKLSNLPGRARSLSRRRSCDSRDSTAFQALDFAWAVACLVCRSLTG